MASIESLPPDQRAVLQLVLQRGRSYDDIAGLLSIDRLAVRQRALAALDALGPGTRLDPEQRGQIADYLLGQLTDAEAAQTRDGLASSAGGRAWARVVASELVPLASAGLPEIPTEGAPEAPPAAPSEPAEPAQPTELPEPPAVPAPRRERQRRPEPVSEPVAAFDASAEDGIEDRPVSRRGGAALIAVVAVVVVVVIVVLIASGGSSSPKSTTNANAGSTTAPATTTTTTGTTGSTGSTGSTGTTGAATPQVLAKFNLTSPTSKTAVGIAELLREGKQIGIAVVGEHIPANTKTNAYAVWLSDSSGHAELLGFVNPGVTSSEELSTAGPLPSNASQYSQLLVTIETQEKPKKPGTIVLEGQVKLSAP